MKEFSPSPMIDTHGNMTWHQESAAGGSLTVDWRTDSGLLGETIGQILAVPLRHLPLWTMDDSMKSPEPQVGQELFNRWKDVPWKGDMQVYVNGSSFWNETVRTFNVGKFKGQPNFFLRALYYPATALKSVYAKLTRNDYYNPMTKAAYVHHPNVHVGMHEAGIGKAYDDLKYPGAITVLKDIIPVVVGQTIDGYLSYQGMNKALTRYKTDREAAEARQIFEPILGAESMDVALPFGYAFVKDLALAYRLPGFIAGHISSRLPENNGRYGWLFHKE